ncbi:MAG: PD-(D/E)XK nuclease family transposase, partial [Sphingobacterium sp.]
LDQWLFVLKNLSKQNKLSVYLRKPIFQKLFEIAEYSKLNEEDRKMYDVSLKRKWDAESIRTTAIQEQEKARQKGLKEGREEGREEGRKEGLAEGVRKKAIEMALKFKKMGVSIADIAEGTGLSIKEIENLK